MPKTKVILTLLCRDESDIIDAFCKFHLSRGIDHIIATDNNSVDGTREILCSYRDRGLLTLIDEPQDNFDQAVWVTRMAQQAAEEFEADWVINSDADEFWWTRTKNFQQLFDPIPLDVQALTIERTNFLPPDPTELNQPFWKSMQIREQSSCNSLGKPLPPKTCHRGIQDIQIGDGNHRADSSSLRIGSEDCKDLEILHYPIRSYCQLKRKIIQGSAALRRNKRITSGVGSTWRHINDEYINQGRFDEYYQNLRPNPTTLRQQLLSGVLIEDPRLYHFLMGEI